MDAQRNEFVRFLFDSIYNAQRIFDWNKQNNTHTQRTTHISHLIL